MSQSASSERDITAYRPDVVRRLLERGISPQTLAAVLPDWEHVIAEECAK